MGQAHVSRRRPQAGFIGASGRVALAAHTGRQCRKSGLHSLRLHLPAGFGDLIGRKGSVQAPPGNGPPTPRQRSGTLPGSMVSEVIRPCRRSHAALLLVSSASIGWLDEVTWARHDAERVDHYRSQQPKVYQCILL